MAELAADVLRGLVKDMFDQRQLNHEHINDSMACTSQVERAMKTMESHLLQILVDKNTDVKLQELVADILYWLTGAL